MRKFKQLLKKRDATNSTTLIRLSTLPRGKATSILVLALLSRGLIFVSEVESKLMFSRYTS